MQFDLLDVARSFWFPCAKNLQIICQCYWHRVTDGHQTSEDYGMSWRRTSTLFTIYLYFLRFTSWADLDCFNNNFMPFYEVRIYHRLLFPTKVCKYTIWPWLHSLQTWICYFLPFTYYINYHCPDRTINLSFSCCLLHSLRGLKICQSWSKEGYHIRIFFYRCHLPSPGFRD